MCKKFDRLFLLIKFLESFQQSVKNNKKGLAFVDSSMCVLNDRYYVKITEESINIKTDGREVTLFAEFTNEVDAYFDQIKELLYEVYYERKLTFKSKRNILKRINFLLKRLRIRYNNETCLEKSED